MESLDILAFIKYFPDDSRAGGGEVTVWNTVKGLADRGHNITAVACDPKKEPPKIPNVQSHIVPPYKNTRPIDFRTSLNWMLKSLKVKADVIHGFYAENFLANTAGKFRGTPSVQEVHYASLYPYTLGEALGYPKKASGILWAAHLRFAEYAAESAKHVITPSEYMKNLLIEKFRLPNEKISVVPIAVNEDVFDVKKKKSGERGKLLFVGRLVKEKGLDALLNALKITDLDDAELTVVGEGPLKEDYISLAKKPGIADRVSFRGWVTRKELLKEFGRADVLVVPSLAENFPRITLEAMGSGTPVVASSVGGIPEQIRDGLNGVLVPPDNPSKLASAIGELIKDPGKIKSLGAEGKKTAKKYSMKNRIDTIERVYERIL